MLHDFSIFSCAKCAVQMGARPPNSQPAVSECWVVAFHSASNPMTIANLSPSELQLTEQSASAESLRRRREFVRMGGTARVPQAVVAY